MAAVVVAGSINMDVVASAARHPRVGETVHASDLRFYPGGKGANQAVAAARLGCPTLLCAALGTDAFGDDLATFLSGCEIDTTHVRRVAHVPTGTALIVVAEADNTIVVAAGANALMDAASISAVPIASDDVLVSQFEIPLPTIEAFFMRGRSAGATTLLNPAPAAPVPATLARLCDVIVVNETELAALLGEEVAADTQPILAAAARLRTLPSQVVVVTLGAGGVVASAPGGDIVVPGRVVRAVDTTGAGDCFVGALAAQLAGRAPLAQALRYANAAAALCVQRPGAGPSMPRAREVENLLSQNA
ncbi:MAG: ribokinase [Actinomycetota bacterium]